MHSSHHSNGFEAQPLEHLEELKHFGGFATVAEKQAKVSALYYPKVSVHRFDRMNKNRWRAGAGKGRRDLAGNYSRLAQSGGYNLSPDSVEA
jgi:hypothetical protein